MLPFRTQSSNGRARSDPPDPAPATCRPGGLGDKLFPPTYPADRVGDPPRHVFERRRVNDREVWCVLIDSVQSQANRMEEALLAAAREDAILLPCVVVDFRDAGLQPLEQITSLDAPHRVYERYHSS